MTDCDALLKAICAHPDEDTPRLAFADWLDEQGNKDDTFRADFIRTHCRLAREEPWSPAWRELDSRWGKLIGRANQLKMNKKLAWVKHLQGRAIASDFERGMVGQI
ncbi:MAG TPA: TIGR02996 domain-containing protein, partial [Gemmataceae bacterium]|nr:TIGR02996 domain-containing protein [Gemmataceae bacterium]